MITIILISILIVTTMANIGFMVLFVKESKKRNRIRNDIYKRFIEDVQGMNIFK